MCDIEVDRESRSVERVGQHEGRHGRRQEQRHQQQLVENRMAGVQKRTIA